MYFTHHFASHETLLRARSWLIHLGIKHDQIETHTDGVPRIAVKARPEQRDQIQLLINAVELTDPKGWPSFWDVAKQEHTYPDVGAGDESTGPDREPTRMTTIHWHPTETPPPSHPELDEYCEIINRKWNWS